jgi:hypothetical protein
VLRGTLRLTTETGVAGLLEPGNFAAMPGLHRHQQELSTDMEVIEIVAPGVLTTIPGWDAPLPERAAGFDPDRRIAFAREAEEEWVPIEGSAFAARDLGVAAITWDLVDLGLVRRSAGGAAAGPPLAVDATWLFVVKGSAEVTGADGATHRIGPLDALCPAGEVRIRPDAGHFLMLRMRLDRAHRREDRA